ncbi:MAG: DUF58 domain-containing protein [Anaerolineales bacterium]|nr:DUF58 domain-containing protein [Anaerolineales bacterium]
MSGLKNMRRNYPLVILLYALLFAGLFSMNGEVLVLAVPIAFYLLAGLWFAPHDIRLHIVRELSAERVTPNMPVKVTLRIVNLGSSLEELLLEDEISPALQIVDGASNFLCRLKAGQSITWSYTISGPRGNFVFAGVEAIARDHLNVSHVMRFIPASGQLFIIPPFTRIKNIAIRPRETRAYSGSIPARIGGPGVEFYGLREYQPGDSPRWINWRASARHPQALFSNEFEQERVADVGVILDGRESVNIGDGVHSLFEHTVIAAAALTDAFISAGNRVGLLHYGQTLRWTFPGYGHVQRERILQSLARAQTGDSSVFEDLARIPPQLFSPNSQLVLISPLKNEDLATLVHLRARGYQVMVVSPDPVSYESRLLYENRETRLAARILQMERRILMLRLQRSGIQALDWDVNLPLDRLVKGRLVRPPAWRNPLY